MSSKYYSTSFQIYNYFMIYKKPFLSQFIKKIIRTNKSYKKITPISPTSKSYEKLLTILSILRLIPKSVNILDHIISFNMQRTPPRSRASRLTTFTTWNTYLSFPMFMTSFRTHAGPPAGLTRIM